MKKTLIIGALAVAACLSPRLAGADDAVPGVRGECIASMMDAGGKVMELASAMPEKKYAWRPAKGVRSTQEVFLHVVGANYMIPGLLGINTGKTMDEAMKLEKSNPGKTEVEKLLKDSYAAATKAISDTPDSDLEQQVDFFGTKMSKRAVIMLLSAHSHEHLGQTIAYARVNGIVPPWTAREQAAAKKAAEEKKATNAGGN